jgi:hypothetical protein
MARFGDINDTPTDDFHYDLLRLFRLKRDIKSNDMFRPSIQSPVPRSMGFTSICTASRTRRHFLARTVTSDSWAMSHGREIPGGDRLPSSIPRTSRGFFPLPACKGVSSNAPFEAGWAENSASWRGAATVGSKSRHRVHALETRLGSANID